MKQLREANLEALSSIETLISSLIERDKHNSVYVSSGIGPHIRHVIDHYLVFMEGIETGFIDYNKRNRNSEIESDSNITLKLIKDIKDWFENSELLKQKEITISSETSSSSFRNISIQSNVERELHYLAYHGIHHSAYCSLLAKQSGFTIDPSIGLAPGTASYLRNSA